MTSQIYTKNILQSKKRLELWTICKQRGLKCYPKNSDCVEGILAAQPQIISAYKVSSYVNHSDLATLHVLDTLTEDWVSQCILHPFKSSTSQTAYDVRLSGQLLGMIFNVHATNTWQSGDGKNYSYPCEAIAALNQITQAVAA
jgi:hypothetical protein